MERLWHGNIYANTCKTDSQWEFAVRLRECKPGLCDNPGGRMGRDTPEGGDICIPMADPC